MFDSQLTPGGEPLRNRGRIYFLSWKKVLTEAGKLGHSRVSLPPGEAGGNSFNRGLDVTTQRKSRKSPSSRRSNAERREESMTIILDHAEAEFASKGYDGTTFVSVAEAAGVDAALMRYYFGDKEQLFAAVFRRRGPVVNALRVQALDAYRAATGGQDRKSVV